MKITDAGRKRANSPEFLEKLHTVMVQFYAQNSPEDAGQRFATAQVILALCCLEDGPFPTAAEMTAFIEDEGEDEDEAYETTRRIMKKLTDQHMADQDEGGILSNLLDMFLSLLGAVGAAVMQPWEVCQLGIWAVTKRLPHSVKRVLLGTCCVLFPVPVTARIIRVLIRKDDAADWSEN